MFKLALDAGHGINTPGKRLMKALDPKQTREWTLNNRICNYIEEEIKEYQDAEVLRVDDRTGKTDVSRGQRCKKANSWGATILLSEHHNAGANGGNAGGIVVYRYPNSTKFTKNMQKNIYAKLIDHTGLKGNRSTPLREKKFDMVTFTNMASVLIENGFMDSKIDVPIILSDKFARQSAKAQVEFLVDIYNLKKKEDKQYLSLGDKGQAVKLLQEDLLELGYKFEFDNKTYGADGSYGKATEKTVKKFQKDNKLSVDGLAGTNTLKKIEELLKKKEEKILHQVVIDGKQVGAYEKDENIIKEIKENMNNAKKIEINKIKI